MPTTTVSRAVQAAYNARRDARDAYTHQRIRGAGRTNARRIVQRAEWDLADAVARAVGRMPQPRPVVRSIDGGAL